MQSAQGCTNTCLLEAFECEGALFLASSASECALPPVAALDGFKLVTQSKLTCTEWRACCRTWVFVQNCILALTMFR